VEYEWIENGNLMEVQLTNGKNVAKIRKKNGNDMKQIT